MHLRHLSRLLTLLLSICYPGGARELDAKECKQNYGKEFHNYVLSAAPDAHDAALRLDFLLGASVLLPVGPSLPAPHRATSLKTKSTPSPGGLCSGSTRVVFVCF